MTLESSISEKPTVQFSTSGTLLDDIEKARTSEFFEDTSYEYGHVYFSAQQSLHFEESLLTVAELPELVAYTPPSPVVASPAAPITAPEDQEGGSVTAPAQQEEAPVTASTETVSATVNQDEAATELPVFQEKILTTIASAHQGDHFVQTAISYAQAPPLINYTPPTTPPSPTAARVENEPTAKEASVKKFNLPIKKDRRRRGYHGRASEEVVVEKPKEVIDLDETAATQEKTIEQERTVPILERKQTESASDLKNAATTLVSESVATTLVSEAIATIVSEPIDEPMSDAPNMEPSVPETTNSESSGMPQGLEHDHLMDLHGRLGTLNGFGQPDTNKSESGDSNTFVHNNYELQEDNTQDFLDDGASYGGSPGPFQDFNDAASFGSIHSFPKDDPLFNFDHQSIINQVFNPQVETINPQFLNLQSNTMDNRPKSQIAEPLVAETPVAKPPVIVKPEPSVSKKAKQKRKTPEVTKDSEIEFEEVPLSRNKRSTKSLSPSKDNDAAVKERDALIKARIDLPKLTRSRKKALDTDTNVKTEPVKPTKKTTPTPSSKKSQAAERRTPTPTPKEIVESQASTNTTASPPPTKATTPPPTKVTPPPEPAKATSPPPTKATPPPTPAKATTPPVLTKATPPDSTNATPPKEVTPPPAQTFENVNETDSETESDQEFVRKPRVIAVEKNDSDSSDSASSPTNPIEPPRKSRPSERRRKVSPVVVLTTPVEESPSVKPPFKESPMKPLSVLRKSRTPTKSHTPSQSPRPRGYTRTKSLTPITSLSQAQARYQAQIKFKARSKSQAKAKPQAQSKTIRQAQPKILHKTVLEEEDTSLPHMLLPELSSIPHIRASTVGVINNTKRLWDEEFRGNATLVKKYGPSTRNTQDEDSLSVFKGPCYRPSDYEIKPPPTQDTGITRKSNVNTYFEYALADGLNFEKYDYYNKSDPVYFRHAYPTTIGNKELLNYKNDTDTRQNSLNEQHSSTQETRKRVASPTPEDIPEKKHTRFHNTSNDIQKTQNKTKHNVSSRNFIEKKRSQSRSSSVSSSSSGWGEPELKKSRQDNDEPESGGPDSGGSTVTESSTYFNFARSKRHGGDAVKKIEEVVEESSEEEEGDLVRWDDEDRFLYQSDDDEDEEPQPPTVEKKRISGRRTNTPSIKSTATEPTPSKTDLAEKPDDNFICDNCMERDLPAAQIKEQQLKKSNHLQKPDSTRTSEDSDPHVLIKCHRCESVVHLAAPHSSSKKHHTD